MSKPAVVLSIAGYDPSSGAGITADIKTAAAHGCYAVTCITALTVQSTQGVSGVQPVEPWLVSRTLAALADDFEIASVRLGMLGSGQVAGVVANFLEANRLPNVVLDPVIRSSSGAALLDDGGIEIVRKRLLSLCDVVTPNIDEAAILVETVASPPSHAGAGLSGDWDLALPRIRQMAAELHRLGAKAVIITGGHLRPAKDYLSYRSPDTREKDHEDFREEVIPGEHIESRSTHGTGCAFATALACRLASGESLPQAARGAKEYVRRAIASAHPLGKGIGPLNHLG